MWKIPPAKFMVAILWDIWVQPSSNKIKAASEVPHLSLVNSESLSLL